MSKKALLGIGIILLMTAVVAACAPQATEEAVLPAEPQVEAETTVAEPADAESDEAASEDTSSDSMEEGEAEQSGEMSEGSSEEDSHSGEEAMEDAESMETVTFGIVQDESEARFTLGELLRGNPKTVVGVTDQVTGEFQVNFENPANSQIGVIQINADTFVTDNSFRNGAIQKFVLQSNQYEYITFTPTSITGLPESIGLGEPTTFAITGDLTIKDVTNEVSFEATVTAVSETRLEGLASTIVVHADYNITIPEVQQVADVDEEVLLEIEFIATPTGN